MQLLDLPNGRMSLELGDVPVARLLDKLKAMRAVRIEQVADVLVIHTPGGRLLLTDDWDRPSLISTTIHGDLLIEVLAAGLTLPVESFQRETRVKGSVVAN